MTADVLPFASVALVRAAGFTLLHSLWQGGLVALLTAALLAGLRHRPAQLRYPVTALALLAVTGLAVLTFGYYYCQAAPTLTPSDLAAPALSAAAPAAAAGQLAVSSGHHLGTNDTLVGLAARLLVVGSRQAEQHLLTLVGLWALGVLGMSVRFAMGIAYTQRLRRHQVVSLPARWQKRVNELVQRAGLRQSVRVLASGLVATPVVIGHFKPLILVPLGAVSGLSAPELEMIFAHEIGHIARRDYLVNVLQSVAEVVFFYNPAVWFLSAGLRTERENCCDDLATELCGNPLLLARALASLAEWTYANRLPQLALAATGPRESALYDRVQRLVRAAPPTTTFSPRDGFGILSIALMSVGIIGGNAMASVGGVAEPLAPAKTAAPLAPLSKGAAGSPEAGALGEPAVSRRETQPPQTADELRASFETHLLNDRLIESRLRYTYKLTARTFSVNGRLQPAGIVAKYRALYEQGTGTKLKAQDAYQTTKNSQSTGPATSLAGAPAPVAAPAPLVAVPAQPDAHKVAQQLIRDGLIAPEAKKFGLVLNGQGLVVDGKQQSPELTEKYRKFLNAPLDPTGHMNTEVSIHIDE
ncbi:M56 family metallopeptidase [Hymenobacter rubripertinctus]|uniref:M56 family metallopeptidase n=1 Tax=Hymenobacter rubripertinctus TaxID=2029981 RepID=A0A418QLM7_9BACT|nr:M56 family metallopeptidase [Hymenobacter rubripertinctus]RIY06055.1 M56 family metallopeptidase [Hymenobacter rubripertinctus]